MKLPVDDPSFVCEPDTVGLCDVPQHTPLEAIAAPPFDEMSPPEVAVVQVILVTEVVDTEGSATGVVNVRSLP